MFNCKFCGVHKPDDYMSKKHPGMCKKCYNDGFKYKREKFKDNRDTGFITKYEFICKSNLLAGRYVPQFYFVKEAPMITCGACGNVDTKAAPDSQKLCIDCYKMHSRYYTYIYRDSLENLPASAAAAVADMEYKFNARYQAGLKVPEAFLKRKGLV